MSFKEWFLKDAKWFEFWLPQSSLLGGLLMALGCGALTAIVYLLLLLSGSITTMPVC